MTSLKRLVCFVLAIACFGIADNFMLAAQSVTHSSNPPHSKEHARSHAVISQALPKLNGDHLKVTIVEVSYNPGEYSGPHSHPCPVFGYVLEGAVRMQVKGAPEHIYHAGQSFYEAPNGVHQVSANASQKAPAKFLAYFVCDHDTPLSVPVPASQTMGAKPR